VHVVRGEDAAPDVCADAAVHGCDCVGVGSAALVSPLSVAPNDARGARDSRRSLQCAVAAESQCCSHRAVAHAVVVGVVSSCVCGRSCCDWMCWWVSSMAATLPFDDFSVSVYCLVVSVKRWTNERKQTMASPPWSVRCGSDRR